MFLGVDGGGTKTAFVLMDRDGHVLAAHQETTAYYLEAGLEAVGDILSRGTAAILAAAGLKTDSIRYAFFGLPSYGEDSVLQAELDALPAAFLPRQRYRCGNDMICGWAGALGGSDGINVVAGTGSIAYGEYAGRAARAGGWGELFSDEGSAYWIAREGLTLFSRMSDGRTDKGLLHALMRERFELANDLDLCAAVYGKLASQRSALAQLSKLVFEAANGGDQQAAAIFHGAAQALSELVVAVRRSLDIPPGVALPVSYSGGVFNSAELVLAPFRAALQSHGGGFALSKPRFAPDIGAALYAARCAGQDLTPDALTRLARDSSYSSSP